MTDLKQRTRQFAVRVIRLVDALPRRRTADAIARQVMRSASSVGANYRAAYRGRSKAEFTAKLGIVEEEIDECVYWLKLMIDSGIMKKQRLAALLAEANEITAIVVASIKTAKRRKQ